jgi:hypothetical protein
MAVLILRCLSRHLSVPSSRQLILFVIINHHPYFKLRALRNLQHELNVLYTLFICAHLDLFAEFIQSEIYDI